MTLLSSLSKLAVKASSNPKWYTDSLSLIPSETPVHIKPLFLQELDTHSVGFYTTTLLFPESLHTENFLELLQWSHAAFKVTILVNFKFPLLTCTCTTCAHLFFGFQSYDMVCVFNLAFTSNFFTGSPLSSCTSCARSLDKLLFCVNHLVSLLQMP